MSPCANCIRFEIKTLHRREARLWKHARLRQSLRQPSHWKTFRSMVHTHAGQAYASQPPLDDFADVFKTMSSGNKFFLHRPATLTETPTKFVTKVGWQQIFFNMFLTISVGIVSFFSFFQWQAATLFTMLPKKTTQNL